MTQLLMITQFVAVALQGSADMTKLIPENYHPIYNLAVAILQALGWHAQKYNDPKRNKVA